jgi:hypothetical protein
MFYQIHYDRISLGHIPRDVTFLTDESPRFIPTDFTSLSWLRPKRDRKGKVCARPITFREWLKTPKVAEQLDSGQAAIFKPNEEANSLVTTMARWLRIRVFGRNTSFQRTGNPVFHDLYDVKRVESQKIVEALPPLTIHEDTCSGVHRKVDVPRQRVRFIPVITLRKLASR